MKGGTFVGHCHISNLGITFTDGFKVVSCFGYYISVQSNNDSSYDLLLNGNIEIDVTGNFCLW